MLVSRPLSIADDRGRYHRDGWFDGSPGGVSREPCAVSRGYVDHRDSRRIRRPSNLGAVPITGQNMPFLGLNAWSDVAICAGVVGILITGAIRRAHESAR